MRRIKLTLAYDGTSFCGWQVQPEARSVQGVVEQALAQLHSHAVNLIAAGRTDAGVHAFAQVAHFDTDHRSLSAEKFQLALNSQLPHDVRILKSEEVSSHFHSRFDAKLRSYSYYILGGVAPTPFSLPFCWAVKQIPRVELLNSLASQVVGTHDFSTFAASSDESSSKVRTLYSASFVPQREFLVFWISGNAFLMKMVRSLVGTLWTLALQEAAPQKMREILESRERERVGFTAVAKGLFLSGVEY